MIMLKKTTKLYVLNNQLCRKRNTHFGQTLPNTTFELHRMISNKNDPFEEVETLYNDTEIKKVL